MYVIIVCLQALLLARIEASMAGDRQLANNLVLPKKLQEEAVRYALSVRHPCTLDSCVVYVSHTHVQLPPRASSTLACWAIPSVYTSSKKQ